MSEAKVTEAAAARRQAQRPISIMELFTLGIGPSSSHTVGPMRAAGRFMAMFEPQRLALLQTVRVELFGSLALTGKGHSTDIAVMMGLSGWQTETTDPDAVAQLIERIRQTGAIDYAGHCRFRFREAEHLLFRQKQFLAQHPNGIRLQAWFADGAVEVRDFYSVGGGRVVMAGEDELQGMGSNLPQPYPFTSAAELLALAGRHRLSIAEIVLANERVWRPEEDSLQFIDSIRAAMFDCIERGCSRDGVLPGGLGVRRRAKSLHAALLQAGRDHDPAQLLDWVSVYALAVNEENAAGGRVVTAPTNGAAGILPAVLRYYEDFCLGATLAGSRIFLLTASAIGFLYKKRASISAAEMGCQGEVGVACSMAAAGLAAALGGNPGQIENAAEIGMEHNLGLTCDPIRGLVQVPCIERNTMGAIQAINAARLAMRGDGQHVVSLDAVIETMRQTGKDMRAKYKETSLGGLAVTVVEC